MRPDIREQLILEHLPYVEKITQIFCATHKQKDIGEFQSIAMESLMFSVNNYDNIKGASLKTWIVTGVRYALIDYRSKIIKQDLVKMDYIDGYSDSLIFSVNGTEQAICNEDLVNKVFQYLDNKPIKRINARTDISKILKLYYIDGYTMKEVAEIKGLSEARISQIIGITIKDIQKHFVNIN